MTRQVVCAVALIVTALGSGVFAQERAQGGAQERPPRFLTESWKALAAPPDDHGAWPASQQGVASPNLQLTLHGRLARRFNWLTFAERQTCIR
jgi:hypothetical protein